jgi:hypothetical protein
MLHSFLYVLCAFVTVVFAIDEYALFDRHIGTAPAALYQSITIGSLLFGLSLFCTQRRQSASKQLIDENADRRKDNEL